MSHVGKHETSYTDGKVTIVWKTVHRFWKSPSFRPALVCGGLRWLAVVGGGLSSKLRDNSQYIYRPAWQQVLWKHWVLSVTVHLPVSQCQSHSQHCQWVNCQSHCVWVWLSLHGPWCSQIVTQQWTPPPGQLVLWDWVSHCGWLLRDQLTSDLRVQHRLELQLTLDAVPHIKPDELTWWRFTGRGDSQPGSTTCKNSWSSNLFWLSHRAGLN